VFSAKWIEVMTRSNISINVLINSVLTFIVSSFFIVIAYADGVMLPKVPDKENFKVFLLAGQSNMAGRGEITKADRTINPQVLMLAKDGSWQYAVDPIHYDKPVAGAGLARSFAIELAKQDKDITIGLIPAAVGGSPIAAWEPGAYFEKTDSHPYDDAISRAKRAMQDGTLSGILWHQGEADAKPDKWPVYKDKLIALTERFRKDLDAPEVPFIIGQLGRFEAKPWTEERTRINQAHAEAATEIKYAGFVSSFGLTSKADNSHFNTKSLHEFGKRYARRYLQVVNEGDDSMFH
jgi:hypothetical protein